MIDKTPTPGPMEAAFPQTRNSNRIEDLYQNLKTSLMSRYTDASIRSIMFVGTSQDDGTTTTASNFARVMATNCGHKVLLVDVNFRTPGIHETCRIDLSPGLAEFITRKGMTDIPIKKLDSGKLYVLPCGEGKYGYTSLFETKRFDHLMKVARNRCDYVILDCPPIPIFPEARALCTRVDGVVLIVQSGKTREHVAFRIRKELEEAGGKILGVVLNKRKYYIPRWIYRRL